MAPKATTVPSRRPVCSYKGLVPRGRGCGALPPHGTVPLVEVGCGTQPRAPGEAEVCHLAYVVNIQ